MKNIVTVIVFFLTLIQTIVAQTFCIHGVSTNYANPKNNSLPTLADSSGSKFLNTFNWLTHDSSGALGSYQLKNMFYNQKMQSVYDNAVSDYYNYLWQGEAPSCENGWELLLLNIGITPNGNDLPSASYTDLPYIVLYNRYKGVIRLFVNYGDGSLANKGIFLDAVKISLKFKGGFSGLLRLNKGYDQSLDQNTEISEILTLAKHPNAYGKWFSSDIQIAYDPCVCYYPSRLRVKFDILGQDMFAVRGRQSFSWEDLYDESGLANKEFLPCFDYSENWANGGLLMYKSLNYFTDDYQAKLEKHMDELTQNNKINAKAERELAIIYAYDHIAIKKGDTLLSVVKSLPWYYKLVTYANDVIGKDALKTEEVIIEAKKIFASGVNTLITTNLDKIQTLTSPSAPAVTFPKMRFGGTYDYETNLAGPNFFTPGTYGSEGTGSPQLNSLFEYPIYNEALGTFALLESPKIIVSATDQNYSQSPPYSDWCVHDDDAHCGFEDISWTKSIQFQLKDNLKYAFNPALDIKNKSIQAALVMKVKTNNPYEGSQFIETNFTSNFTSSNYDLNNNTEIRNDAVLDVSTPFIPIDAFKSLVSGIGIKSDFKKMICPDGRYCPPQEVAPQNSIKLSDIIIELKLLVEMEYEMLRSDSTKNTTTQVLTYKIRPEDIFLQSKEIYPNLKSSFKDINQYCQNLSLKTTVFNGTEVNGCKLIGNTYTCKAYNNISIDGDLSIAGTYTVNIVAGNGINKALGVTIDTSVTLSKEAVLDFSTPMPESTAGYVANFCKGLNSNSPAYRANTYEFKSLKEKGDSGKPKDEPNYQIYPNPSNGLFTLNTGSDGVKSIIIYDLLGVVIYQKLESSAQKLDIDITSYSKGIYFIKVIEGGELKIVKVVYQ
jgi:Secretion system C-terminal sorting domain